MTTYPGLPSPEISDHLSRADSQGRFGEGIELQIGRICMVGNTGTYIDVPFHFYEDGDDLVATSLERLCDLPTVAADLTGSSQRAIIASDLENIDVTGDLNRPAHAGLLRHGIPIVEHMRGLELLSGHDVRFTAAPPMVAGLGTFPVRAFARIC